MTMNILSWPQTPLGSIWAVLDSENNLTDLKWGEYPATAQVTQNHPLQTPLAEYFGGHKALPSSLSQHLKLQGTPFQQRITTKQWLLRHEGIQC